jgi:diacylglycerol kinase family enzyme
VKSGVSILCNPDSGRVRGRLAEIRALGRRIAGESYIEVNGQTIGGGAVLDLLARRPELLVVIGGDGTLHALLDQLLAPGRSVPLPALLAVPGGTTNMSMLDLGMRGRPLAVLERLQERLERQDAASLPSRERRILQISRSGAAPLHGMFFGAGIIARGVQYFSDYVRGTGITGEVASGLVMARFLAALLGADRGGLAKPTYAEIEGMNGTTGRQPYLAILASVLDRLLLGARPYWGSGPAPVHATAIRAAPARMLASIPSILRGRGERLRAEDGYASANVDTLSLRLEGPFVVDGESYDAAGASVVLSAPASLRFVGP